MFISSLGPCSFRFYVRGHLLMGTILVLLSASVQAQDTQTLPPCEEAIARAEAKYFEPQFDEAIRLLTHCLSQEAFDVGEKEEAYKLLGKVYFAKGLEAQAMDALRELMVLVPSYRPTTITEPPRFVELVDRVREELAQAAPPPDEEAVPEEPVEAEPEVVIVQPQEEEPLPPVVDRAPPEKKGITKWLLIGGGVAVASVAAVLLTGGGDGPMTPTGMPLPTPPTFPAR